VFSGKSFGLSVFIFVCNNLIFIKTIKDLKVSCYTLLNLSPKSGYRMFKACIYNSPGVQSGIPFSVEYLSDFHLSMVCVFCSFSIQSCKIRFISLVDTSSPLSVCSPSRRKIVNGKYTKMHLVQIYVLLPVRKQLICRGLSISANILQDHWFYFVFTPSMKYSC